MRGKINLQTKTFYTEGVETNNFLLAQCLWGLKVCSPHCVAFQYIKKETSPLGSPHSKVLLRCVQPHLSFEVKEEYDT